MNYVLAQASAPTEELMLPGATEALFDAPVLARAIGDHVKHGQLPATIAAPDLEPQALQARTQLSQSEAVLKQAVANQVQGHADETLARVTPQTPKPPSLRRPGRCRHRRLPDW
jgi:hypothetical protein